MIKDILSLCLVDQAIKLYIDKKNIKKNIKVKDIATIEVKRYENHGIAFNGLEGRDNLIKYIMIVAISAFAGYAWSERNNDNKAPKLTKMASSLIIGGGLSNIIDRFCRGYCVDYFTVKLHKKPSLKLKIKSLKRFSFLTKPLKRLTKKLDGLVFNIGDIFIVLGTILLGLRSLIKLLGGRNE